jgi:hypothetical protein
LEFVSLPSSFWNAGFLKVQKKCGRDEQPRTAASECKALCLKKRWGMMDGRLLQDDTHRILHAH